jgi:rhamnopyranosyl-N-acetylglucosaminyl-diphospho-decaprenol beta-1,3/1,4-galactofuranosyltransferase
MPENTGGAGGFHEGMKRAAAAQFDWLWLMDDDLWTAPDALEALVRKKNERQAAEQKPFLLNSLVLARNRPDGDTLACPLQELTARGYPRRGIYHWRLSEVRDQIVDGLYCWACPFNGTFVPVGALAEIGLPNRDFYIQGDEKDFLWRAARWLDVYTVIDSKVFHPEFHLNTFDWKAYYNIRNMFVVNRHFNFPALRNLRLTLLSLGRGLRHGRRGLVLVLRAIRDGWAGRLGRREDLDL